MKLISRISIREIISKHIGTMYHYGHFQATGEKKLTGADKFTFILLPIVVSVSLSFLDYRFVSEFSELITTSLSIFTGLLFNLLVLVYDLTGKMKEKVNAATDDDGINPDQSTKDIFELVKELFINISYSIILSILCIALIFGLRFRPGILIDQLSSLEKFEDIKHWTIFGFNTIVLFFLLQFVLTLLVILSRFFTTFKKQSES